MNNDKSTRRKFIKNTGWLAGSLWMPPLMSCGNQKKTSARKKEQLGIALVGLGGYSTDQLAPALQLTQHCALKGIVTGSPEKVPAWQEKYGIPDTHVYDYESMHRIADNDDIDVIYIVVPTGLHMKYATIAADAGKHVWCEKPMALDVEQCRKIINACDKNGVMLSIGYRMQHDPHMQEIIRLTREKTFGDLTGVHAAAGYNGGGGTGWRFQKSLGGGALYDMGVYTINGIRHASQLEPTHVISATQSTKRPQIFSEVDETTEYILGFEGDLIASGKTSVGEGMNILQVSCQNGSYMLSPMQSYSGIKGERSDGQKSSYPVVSQQALQMDHDALAILNGSHVLVPGIDGLRDIRIVNAIQYSAASGQEVRI